MSISDAVVAWIGVHAVLIALALAVRIIGRVVGE